MVTTLSSPRTPIASQDVSHSSAATDGSALVQSLLQAQERLTAVDRFANDKGVAAIAGGGRYRDLIPLSAPNADEQYAFEVDLDACSGCKACVAACHSLNGLDDSESFRSVGLLHGGSTELAVLQHVTSACHHCLDPACMTGCPVGAYEKNAQTGIVRHLDDQCIGCQYCVLACPYDVPKYNKAKGIVRKCDMCSDRLAHHEAPACAQACPTSAIRITTVRRDVVLAESETGAFLPGAPDPGQTLPTTRYRTSRVFPRNLLPADYYSVSPEHGHPALVAMLTLTQMSVGCFVFNFLYSVWGLTDFAPAIHDGLSVSGVFFGMLGIAASVFHLGRPLYAFRAVVGLRTSWLSREILAFGLFAASAVSYGLLSHLAASYSRTLFALGLFASLAGIVGVASSAMIYAFTRRPFWSFSTTCAKFALTAFLLGGSSCLALALVVAAFSEAISSGMVMEHFGKSLCRDLVFAQLAKLAIESSVFSHLRERQNTPLKRTALLMTGDLARPTAFRFLAGFVGGVLTPLLLSVNSSGSGLFGAVLALVSVALLLVGEFLERHLFFAAVVAGRMPGGGVS